MKLSELSFIRDQIYYHIAWQERSYLLSYVKNDLKSIDYILRNISNNNPLGISFDLSFVKTIEQNVKNLDTHLKQFIIDISRKIEELAIIYHKPFYLFDDSGNHYTELLDFNWEVNIKKIEESEDLKNDVIGQIYKYSHYKYPALEIGPGMANWTDFLVASDPLYILDFHKESYECISKKFSETYLKRLRFYCNKHNKFDFTMLPQNQIGFIFSWNVFDYYTLESLNKLLTQSFNVLRPGGYMLFSYNNCTVTNNIKLVECGVKSWLTVDLIKSVCEPLGFEFVENRNILDQHYCVIKKAGELSTIKLQQALGRIISVPS